MNFGSEFIRPYNSLGSTEICGKTYTNGFNRSKKLSTNNERAPLSVLKNNKGISNTIYLNIFTISSAEK